MLANGSVLTFSPAGKLIRERPFDAGAVQAAVLAAPGLIVETAAGLEIHSGRRRRGLSRCRRAPASSATRRGIVAYGIGRELRLRRLANGNDRLFRTLEPRFHAQLGRRGLVYASGRTLGFSVWAIVTRRRLDRRDLDLEEVAVEPAADDELAVLDQFELVLLEARERPHLDPLRRRPPRPRRPGGRPRRSTAG